MEAGRTEELKKIGKAIRQSRTDQSLTQEEFSTQIKMNRSYLGGVERGERNITVEGLIRISESLQIKLWELFKKANL